MKTYFIILAALFFLASCGSDSADGNYNRAADEDLIEEQVDTGTKATIDSVAQAAEEGTILQPLPDTLVSLLEQRQPETEVATLTDQAMANKRLQVDNPLFLRGNLNGNSTPDYAVQVLQNDSIHLLAFLDYTQKPQEVKVATYPAQQLNGRRYSSLQLKLAPQDSLVRNPRRQKITNLKADGISVLQDNRTTLYVLQNGRFIPFDAQE
ncbi:hypothetical protein [Pontibacter mangrovi]|uniref:Uncharacterized protein n=1 Tax=Pontibacter mangrovi TaxID=2589816 RepID=A0A501WDL7_9BACT|nr:hypothetical protein [Pontibacter mangrovi]TPE45281.1 hypothetical protein FJM65_04375 [Pontibacter mangrovi]